MGKDKKDYEKALNLYNTGYIDRAIEVCEVGISRNLKDSNLLNLKGLLLYLKGNLEEAISLWKINEDYNSDNIAKAYLIDAEKDFYRRELFKETDELIRSLNIDEALENLSICNESDFNLIGVNNALAICYLRKGEYDNSKICINRVLTVDKNNITAKSIDREINEILNIRNSSKLVLNSIIITSLIFITITTGVIIKTKIKSIPKNEEYLLNNDVKDTLNDINEDENNQLNNIDKEKDVEENNIINSVNDKDNKANNEIDKPLTEEEIRDNYIAATNLFAEGKYSDAKILLEKDLKYSEKSHLNDDILFLLASTDEKIGNKEDAIKYFEGYIYNYENGNYIEEAYYKVALLYKDIDIEKSKSYAQALVNKYQNSIYNNNIIKGILNI